MVPLSNAHVEEQGQAEQDAAGAGEEAGVAEGLAPHEAVEDAVCRDACAMIGDVT